MPRTSRKKSKTGIYHIILRGINKQIIFEDEEDHYKFLQTIIECKEKSEYKIYAYCLMGNHIHILIKEGKEDLGMAMRRIGATYVYWYNWKHDRVGHLFQGRYKSEVVEEDAYLLTVLRYIHQNPLKAGMVEDIKKYTWSSYLEYIGKNKIVDSDFILNKFNIDRTKAITEFVKFHEQESDKNCLDISEQKRIKDQEAIEIIKDICQINQSTDLQRIEKESRDRYLHMIKEQGLSTRQIARLTGNSRSIVLRVKEEN